MNATAIRTMDRMRAVAHPRLRSARIEDVIRYGPEAVWDRPLRLVLPKDVPTVLGALQTHALDAWIARSNDARFDPGLGAATTQDTDDRVSGANLILFECRLN